jgi:hypothetical protein
MMRFIKENKKAIIISLIVGIIVFCLQPIVIFVGTQLVNLFVSINNKFSNYFYRLIARNDPNLISDYVAAVTTILFYLVVLYSLNTIWDTVSDQESELTKLERLIKGSEDGSKKVEIDIESEIPKLRKRMNILKVTAKVTIIISLFFYLYLAIQQGIYSQVNVKNVSFQNKLTVLSVHLSDNEIKQLRAKWVQMKSADDYKQIMNSIADYDKKYNVPE